MRLVLVLVQQLRPQRDLRALMVEQRLVRHSLLHRQLQLGRRLVVRD